MEISKNDIVKLLRLNDMSKTSARISLIFLLIQANSWLSLQDISKQMKQSRTTIYRALNILCEKAIVKKLVDTDNKVFFHFNEQPHLLIPSAIEKKELVYFRCINCNSIILLQNAYVDFKLPQGFIKTGDNFLVSGYCSHCSDNMQEHGLSCATTA